MELFKKYYSSEDLSSFILRLKDDDLKKFSLKMGEKKYSIFSYKNSSDEEVTIMLEIMKDIPLFVTGNVYYTYLTKALFTNLCFCLKNEIDKFLFNGLVSITISDLKEKKIVFSRVNFEEKEKFTPGGVQLMKICEESESLWGSSISIYPGEEDLTLANREPNILTVKEIKKTLGILDA